MEGHEYPPILLNSASTHLAKNSSKGPGAIECEHLGGKTSLHTYGLYFGEYKSADGFTSIKTNHHYPRDECKNIQDSFSRVVEPGTSLNLAQMDMSLKKLHELVNPVIGFVANEPNSLVKGYIIKKQFYGTIRIYDKHRLYHVVYYIEPLS
ncbi:unnamed protein product, partial [Allacma fusca]